eukprot:2433151-Rhodomonas_salina.1
MSGHQPSPNQRQYPVTDRDNAHGDGEDTTAGSSWMEHDAVGRGAKSLVDRHQNLPLRALQRHPYHREKFA